MRHRQRIWRAGIKGVAVLRVACAQFSQKNAWVLSSHIAMSMMMALFPFVLFTVALGGTVAAILSESVEITDLVEPVFSSWPQSVADPIKTEVYAVLNSSGTGLITLGGLLALYFASNGVDAVRIAMVRAYGQKDERSYFKRRAICAGLVILGGIGILCAAFFEVALPLAARFLTQFVPDSWPLAQWKDGLHGVFAAGVPVAAVFLYHLMLPAKRLGVSDILPGAVFTLGMWWGMVYGFAIYVSHFASYSTTYAGLASAMAALIFLYFNAAILIFGAELNGAIAVVRQERRS